jgi:hypothetical protein
MGALFVLVVLFLPNGIASIFEKIVQKAGFETPTVKLISNTKTVEGQ